MKKSLHTLFAAAALLVLSTAIHAQQLPQANDAYYTSAQDRLKQTLSRQPITARARNVILLIADGNGVGTNYATRLFQGQKMGKLGDEHVLSYEEFPNLALVKTYNINAQTPGSAATAGAMNTGVKQMFSTINLNDKVVLGDCGTVAGNELTTFSEIVSRADKSVGVVSTARLTHATPAAVYAKTANRGWEASVPADCTAQKDIAIQLLEAIGAGTVDFAMGGGRRNFVASDGATDEGGKGRREDGRNLIEEAKAAGVQYAWNAASVGALKLDGATPVLALLADNHMNFEFDRRDEDEPSLAAMTKLAIEFLSQNEEGYYLEIEAGRVDHASHHGNLHRSLSDGVAFAEAVAMADQLTDDQDTLIIVTADHEHAIAFNGYCGRGTPITGLCMGIAKGQVEHTNEPRLAADGKPYTVVGYLNGPGSVLTRQADGSYSGTRALVDQQQAIDPEYQQQAAIPMSSETHSGEDVAVYAKGPWAHLFDGTIEQNYIFHVMNHAISAQ